MKKLLPLLLVTSCGPYYVGAQPVDVLDEMLASRPTVIADPVPDFKVESPREAEPTVGPLTEAVAPAPVIGWDGREVVPENQRPLHGLSTDPDTHSNLLGMYMDAKESVDHLKLEVASMGDLLSHQDGILAQKAGELTAKDEVIASLQLQIASELADRNDLEARLVTAQIRRLEAEKQLLINILGADPEEAEEPVEAPVESVAQAKP